MTQSIPQTNIVCKSEIFENISSYDRIFVTFSRNCGTPYIKEVSKGELYEILFEYFNDSQFIVEINETPFFSTINILGSAI